MKKWTRMALCTSPLKNVKSIINNIYKVYNTDVPKHTIIVDCPITGVYAAHLCNEIGPSRAKSKKITLQDALCANLDSSFLEDMLLGPHEAQWLAIVQDDSRFQSHVKLAASCGWWAPYDDVAIVQHRPTKINVDDDLRLHCSDGPAVEYKSGWKIYAHHGILIPETIIENPTGITIEQIIKEDDPAVRKMLRDKYGASKFLDDSKAKIIDIDSIPVDRVETWGQHITRALMEDHNGDKYLISSDGSTNNIYVMGVPKVCTTCRMAHMALSGLRDSDGVAES